MITRDSLWLRLCELLHEVAQVNTGAIREDARIGVDLDLESIAFVEIAVTLEEELDIQIDPIEILERRDLGDILTYLWEIVKLSESYNLNT